MTNVQIISVCLVSVVLLTVISHSEVDALQHGAADLNLFERDYFICFRVFRV